MTDNFHYTRIKSTERVDVVNRQVTFYTHSFSLTFSESSLTLDLLIFTADDWVQMSRIPIWLFCFFVLLAWHSVDNILFKCGLGFARTENWSWGFKTVKWIYVMIILNHDFRNKFMLLMVNNNNKMLCLGSLCRRVNNVKWLNESVVKA